MGRYAAKKRQEEEAKRKKHEAEIAAKRKKINEDRKAGKTSNIPKKEKDAPVNKEATKKGNERMREEKEAAEAAKKEKNKVTGKGPVADADEYGKHLDEVAKNKEKAKIKKPEEKTEQKPKKEAKKSTVFTRHYKTGKTLGVMTRAQRRKYDAEAAGRTFEDEVAKYEKESAHGKKHLRESIYKASQRKGSREYKKNQARQTAKATQTKADTINKRSKQLEEAKQKQKENQKPFENRASGNGKPKTNGKTDKPKNNKQAGDKIKDNVKNGKQKQKDKKKSTTTTKPGLRPPSGHPMLPDPNANIASARIKSGGSRRIGKKNRSA